MTGTDFLQSVQFVTVKGKRLEVMSAEDWESLVEWLETLEDVHLARVAFQQLKTAGGDREKAGWVEWGVVEAKLREGKRMTIAAQALLNDYQSDPEVTAFTTLDGEGFRP
ncbi:MAG: hypothetical protein L0Z70_15630 [Chloroflexi bacterium]|nr:hypothetical protein [Chloroflexota bacterium]